MNHAYKAVSGGQIGIGYVNFAIVGKLQSRGKKRFGNAYGFATEVNGIPVAAAGFQVKLLNQCRSTLNRYEKFAAIPGEFDAIRPG